MTTTVKNVRLVRRFHNLIGCNVKYISTTVRIVRSVRSYLIDFPYQSLFVELQQIAKTKLKQKS